jgi:hypothetical protein
LCLDILKIKFLSNGGQFGFKEREAWLVAPVSRGEPTYLCRGTSHSERLKIRRTLPLIIVGSKPSRKAIIGRPVWSERLGKLTVIVQNQKGERINVRSVKMLHNT